MVIFVKAKACARDETYFVAVSYLDGEVFYRRSLVNHISVSVQTLACELQRLDPRIAPMAVGIANFLVGCGPKSGDFRF